MTDAVNNANQKAPSGDYASANQIEDNGEADRAWVEALSNQKAGEKAVMLDMSNVEEDKGKKSSRLRKLLYFLLLCCAVAIIVLAVKLSQATGNTSDQSTDSSGTSSKSHDKTSNKDGNEGDLCLSEACVLASAQIFEYMDKTKDPCDSFYDYACGGWRQSHTIPNDKGSLATYTIMRDDVANQIKGLLEENTTSEEADVFKNLKHLYQSCTNEELIEERNVSVIFPLLKEFGGWPLLGDSPGGEWNESEYDLVRLLVSLLKYSNNPLISAWAGMDQKNNTKYILYIDQSDLGLPERNYYLDASLKEKFLAYKKLIRNIAVMLGASETTIDDDVEDILSLETDLANITMRREDRRNTDRLYNAMTIKELQDNFTTIKECEKTQFNWLQYFQGAMDFTDENVTLTEDEVVILKPIPYFTQLWDVLNSYSPRTITNYAVWRMVKNRYWNLPSRFRDEYHEYKKTLYGTPTQAERWTTCVWYAKNTAKLVIGRMYVERYMEDEAKTEMTEVIKNIRTAFQLRMEDIDWMDDTMKTFAKEKAEWIVEAVAYPDNIMNDTYLTEHHSIPTVEPTKHFENTLTILKMNGKYYFEYLRRTNDMTGDRVGWTTSPTTVNAFYSPQRNQITFPAGIMHPPYFHPHRTRAMNYGGLGFLVGHEITHGFDDRGRKYDKIGNLYNWWSQEAEDKFNKKKQCLIEQYGNYFWEDAGMKINGVNTIGENIADNGGLKQAYRGYKKWSEDNADLKLPGVDFSFDQLFFLGFSQTRCDLNRHDSAVNRILTGVHSPLRFRVDGTLRNMPEFAEVFNCPVNSSMNPVHKCAVW